MYHEQGFYKYACLGRKFALFDFLHRGGVAPSGYEPIRLDVSASALAVVDAADAQALFCIGAFFIMTRGLPLTELDICVAGKNQNIEFLHTGADEIGMHCGECKLKLTNIPVAASCGTVHLDKVLTPLGSVLTLNDPTADGVPLELYSTLGAPIALARRVDSEGILMSSFPRGGFDVPSALALSYRFGNESVSDGEHKIKFTKSDGKTFIFSKILLD